MLSIPSVGWDASRPVPWRRLIKEYLIYAVIMGTVLLLLFRDAGVVALLLGLVAAGPIYLALGAVLAKFGYQRKTLAEMRTPRATTSSEASGVASDTAVRERPAPTRRTAGNSQRPRQRPPSRKRR